MVVLLVYGGLLGLTYVGFANAPRGFIPAQDKGYLLVNVQLPDSASLQRTEQVMERIEEIAGKTPGVKHTVAIAGQSILLNANAPNFGAMYVMLDDFHHRTARELSGDAIAARLQSKLAEGDQDGVINVFGAPPVDGLGTAGGFKIVVEDRGDTGHDSALQDVADGIVASRSQGPRFPGLVHQLPRQYALALPGHRPHEAKTMGVSMAELFNTLQVYLGSLYVNDFNRFGRTWQVNVQAAADFRKQIEDLKQLKIRSDLGKMVPLGSLASVEERSGPVMIMRYNMYPSAAINITPAPGVSSGQAIDRTENVVRPALAALDALRVDRAGPAAAADRQHGDAASFSWRWCWCSWCWPPSTRAGRCRWRSSWSCRCACSARSPAFSWHTWTSTSSRRSASSCWSAWRARTPF